MHITLLCNAGLAINHEGHVLLIDVPNCDLPPFAPLQDEEWGRIYNRKPPYDRLAGVFITHNHPDHCDMERIRLLRNQYPEIPVFLPNDKSERGTIVMGPFVVSYEKIDHAPMDVPTPPHVVAWIRAGGKCLYIAADAKLDADAHRRFLKGRIADAAFWNAMYLSRPETRALLRDTSMNNLIYHMPPKEPDAYGIWKKCRINFARSGNELTGVMVLSEYPSAIAL